MENICLDCGAKFTADHHTDQCSYCWEQDTNAYANDPTPGPDVSTPWKLSKPVMRERLSVSGDRDE